MRTGTDCRGRLWEEISLGKAKDLTNKKFFSLTPLFRVKNMEDKNSSNAYWLCECECEYAWNHNIPIVRIPYYDIDKICLNSLFDDTFLIRRGDNDDHR